MALEAVSERALDRLPEFSNTKLTDFSDPENRRQMQAAIGRVKKELGQEYPLVIGGRRIITEAKFCSFNPSRKTEVVGVFQKAAEEQAGEAVRAAAQAFESWKRTGVRERAAWLLGAAAEMRRRKFQLSAWMVMEVGKTWPEADADTAEAIDFCEFYIREALRLQSPCASRVTPLPGERNELCYLPLGAAVVIPPWNFPLAITTGMTTAALVSGNTVVLKPSSDSPAVAYKMCEILWQAGLPAGVLNFLPGSGGVIGDALVRNPLTRFIAFTGSKEVGLHINELAAKHQPGQMWIKRVIAEMGGKDSIIVDNETDLDKAADAVVVSAYGFQGEKCSACSRAIVLDSVYDQFLDRLKQRVEKIRVGPADDPDNYMGPVINEPAMTSILNYIEIGKKEGRLVAGGGPAAEGGYFIQPTVIADVDPKARIAQEEIFGPVLAVIRARDFDQALQIANNTEYGLTGSVFSNNREKLEKARGEFHAGNLYFNRKCTGAMVGGHPFGGFNMSGTDSKAGGRDYLLLFTQAKAVSEKTG
jgi:1-pyrroline-5-carboxylate dehydrogenase